MKKSDSIATLAKALVKARGQITGAVKDSKNPFFKSDYANLESVIDSSLPALLANGIVVSQLSGIGANGKGFIETMLIHESGEWMSGEFPIESQGNDPQKLGSATTYARRYAWAAAIGITQIDDDGNAASNPGKITPSSMQPSDEDGYDDGVYRFPMNASPKGVQVKGLTMNRMYEKIGTDGIEDMVMKFEGIVSGKVESRMKLDEKRVYEIKEFLSVAEDFLHKLRAPVN